MIDFLNYLLWRYNLPHENLKFKDIIANIEDCQKPLIITANKFQIIGHASNPGAVLSFRSQRCRLSIEPWKRLERIEVARHASRLEMCGLKREKVGFKATYLPMLDRSRKAKI